MTPNNKINDKNNIIKPFKNGCIKYGNYNNKYIHYTKYIFILV